MTTWTERAWAAVDDAIEQSFLDGELTTPVEIDHVVKIHDWLVKRSCAEVARERVRRGLLP